MAKRQKDRKSSGGDSFPSSNKKRSKVDRMQPQQRSERQEETQMQPEQMGDIFTPDRSGVGAGIRNRGR